MRKIKNKLLTVIITISLLMSIILSGISVLSLLASQKHNLELLDENLRTDFDHLIKSEVETIVSLISSIHKEYEAGKMTLNEAKNMAANLVRELRYGADGYFWIDTYDGTNVVLLGKDAEGKNRYELQDVQGNYLIKGLIKAGQEGGGYTDYYFPKKGSDVALPKRAYSLAFEPFEWIIGTGNYTDDIDNILATKRQEAWDGLLRQQVIIFAGSFLCFIISLFFGLAFSKKLTGPIEAVTSYIHTLSTGDFTQKLPDKYFKLKDEIGTLVQSTEKMRQAMRDLLERTENVSRQLLASSEQLATTAEQSSQVSDEIAKSISEIAQGSVDQAKNTSDGSDKLQELGTIIDDDQRLLDDILGLSGNIMTNVNDGLTIIKDLSQKTTENNTASSEVYKHILETNESSKKIGEASNLIASMAEQTSLLALNAAIEAARAGEHGRGFAIVADEIRMLAEQSTQSTKLIDSMVQSLQQNATSAVDTITKVKDLLEEQVENVSATANKYDQISSNFTEAQSALDTLEKASGHMFEAKNEVSDIMQTLSAVAEENAAGTEEITASIQEQTASMVEVAKSSDELYQLAQDLEELIKRFKV